MMKPMFEEFFIFFIIYLKQNNRKLIFDLTFKLELIVFNIIRYYINLRCCHFYNNYLYINPTDNFC